MSLAFSFYTTFSLIGILLIIEMIIVSIVSDRVERNEEFVEIRDTAETVVSMLIQWSVTLTVFVACISCQRVSEANTTENTSEDGFIV